MAQKPLSEMADTGYENMSEEVGYVLHEWKSHANVVDQVIESKADKSEFYQFVNFVDMKLSSGICHKDYIACITALAEKLDAANAAIRALTDKLDAEDVTNLDTDYRATVDALIK